MAMSTEAMLDLTTCSICFETYRTPKHFSCLHSFCEGCIQSYITANYGETTRGVNCPVCRMLVLKPDNINIEEWSANLPTNHILVSLIDMKNSRLDPKLCSACARDNESQTACSWCVNCGEALCQTCDRSHRKNKASRNHRMVNIDDEGRENIPQQHADVFCTDHPVEIVKAYCSDHAAVCCMTCVMLKHRKCDNVSSIEHATEAKKQSKEIKNFAKNLQDLKKALEAFVQDRAKNLQHVHNDIAKVRSEIEALFQDITLHLNALKTNILKEVSNLEKAEIPEIQNQQDVINYRISAVETNLALFKTNMSHAAPAQFLEAMEKLSEQKTVLSSFVKDVSLTLKKVKITFHANTMLSGMSTGIREFGSVNVNRTENNRVLYHKGLSFVPTLILDLNTDFSVTGVAILLNGQVIVSNGKGKALQLRDSRCTSVLSTLPLEGHPCGIKMTSNVKGAVAVSKQGLVIFDIHDNQIRKVAEINTDINSDFAFGDSEYYIACSRKIQVYDSNNKYLRSILSENRIERIAYRDNTSLCFTYDNECAMLRHSRVNSGPSNSWRRNKQASPVQTYGEVSWVYSHDKLKESTGVTSDHVGNIYVCGYRSKNVHQLTHDGKLESIIFDNLPSHPNCISLNVPGDKVVIGCSDKILLYELGFSTI